MPQILYAVNGLSGGTSSLYTINKSTGKATLVGSIGFPTVKAIAFHPVTNVLYGLSTSGVNTADLITINTATGAGTLVTAVTGSLDMRDMSFHPTTNQLWVWTEVGDDVVVLNIATGTFTTLAVNLTSVTETGAAFRSDGVLFVKSAQTVGSVDLISGTFTLVGIILTGAPYALQAALAFDEDDVPYSIGFVASGSNVLSKEDTLMRINSTFTLGAAVGDTGMAVQKFDSLAFGPSSTYVASTRKPIPVPTSLAPQTPCAPKSELTNGGKGKFGCNNGGLGRSTIYSGPFGSAPSHADPEEGEDLDGKEFAGIEVWVRLYRTSFPDGAVSMIQRAMVDLADLPSYEFGRKAGGLLSVGDVGHSIGNEKGGVETGDVNLKFVDVDHEFRIWINTQDLEGDEVEILMASDAARGAF